MLEPSSPGVQSFLTKPSTIWWIFEKRGPPILISFDQSEIAIILVYNSIQFVYVHQFSNLKPPPSPGVPRLKSHWDASGQIIKYIQSYFTNSLIFAYKWYPIKLISTLLRICDAVTISKFIRSQVISTTIQIDSNSIS